MIVYNQFAEYDLSYSPNSLIFLGCILRVRRCGYMITGDGSRFDVLVELSMKTSRPSTTTTSTSNFFASLG
jgi:hypothetical protein